MMTVSKLRPCSRLRPLAAAVLAGLAAVAVTAGTSRADVRSGLEALQKGSYPEAEAELKTSLALEKGPAALALAQLYWETGRYQEAIEQATAASLEDATRDRALCLAGEVFRETGKTADAVKMFQAALQANPRQLRARLYLGLTLLETGQKPEAEKQLSLFPQEFNAGKIDKTKADQLTYTAIAARYLRQWQDANETFQDALEKDPTFLLAQLEYGDLFLLKYRADEAAKNYQEALKLNKNHPRALTGMAGVIIEASYDVPKATRILDQALAINPKYVPALNLKAKLALDDERFAEAEGILKQSLAVNPVDLQALALQAASRYLQDDTAGYEAVRQTALKQNPQFSDFYFQIGELAVRQHRYADAVKLNRQAIALDPKNANALAAAATNLTRQGFSGEAEALKMLQTAFQQDPFNVRTFNTLNLYEEVIGKEYASVPGAVFQYRFNKQEKPLLERYVPQLMQRAWGTYTKKYGFTPPTPITVELFTERQHYGARTLGLPEIGAQGTCFGSLITAMSPSSAEASWELVLWHELGHVFHLGISKNRVARWFTEGLCEYETNIERPYWKREHGREIYEALADGSLWKIGELSAAFVRPGRPNGVVIAYQQSSLVIHYLAESFGFPKLVEALRLYGEGKHDDQIFPQLTGKSMDELDAGFREWLKKKYDHYVRAWEFDPEKYADLGKLQSAAKERSTDAAAQAALAAGLLVKKDPATVGQAKKALALDAKNPLARYALAQALLGTGDRKAARTELETLLANGADSFTLRFTLGQLLLAEGDAAGAVAHLDAAKKLDPDRSEPYELLIKYYDEQDQKDPLLKQAEALMDLEEHDHDNARLLIDRFALERRWEDLARVAPRVLAITPMEPFVHQEYGRALVNLGKTKEAVYELESALIGGVRRPAAIRALLARQYLALGDKVKAKAAAQQALKEDPKNAEALDVMKKLGP